MRLHNFILSQSMLYLALMCNTLNSWPFEAKIGYILFMGMLTFLNYELDCWRSKQEGRRELLKEIQDRQLKMKLLPGTKEWMNAPPDLRTRKFDRPNYTEPYLALDWWGRWWVKGKVTGRIGTSENMYGLEISSSSLARWSPGVIIPVWIDELSQDFTEQLICEV